ncbi:hypothetical protein AURDEDRAFT_167681 [Auricularia subglabra TFB-10046 SS5]|nr:hypothetical protein AURDEDRAFT_167681 [Auricularia subglabra TFB-10046 SS5]
MSLGNVSAETRKLEAEVSYSAIAIVSCTIMGITSLPVELHEPFFALLNVRDVIRAAHVCAHWRAIAFDSPSYWADITVGDVAPAALDFAEHRAQQGGNRLLNLTINYTEKHDGGDDPMLQRVLPLLCSLLPRVRDLRLTVASVYRSGLEDSLCAEAPNLRLLRLTYASDLLADLRFDQPLGHQRTLLAGHTGNLRVVHLYDVVFPENPIPAFRNVDEVLWMTAMSSVQPDFPSYLFDFFPECTRLRMTGGGMGFANAPLPWAILEKFRMLKWVDIEFPIPSLSGFFTHLPMDDLYDLTVCSPDDDYTHRTLKPLLSPYHVDLGQNGPDEFFLSVKGDKSQRVRRFAEPLKYYYAGTPDMSPLLGNGEFFERVTTLSIHLSLWSRLKPWLLPSYPALSQLIVSLNVSPGLTAQFPEEELACPGLKTLVIQAESEFACVDAEELVKFANRIGSQVMALELRSVIIRGERGRFGDRFSPVEHFSSIIDI